MRRRILLVAAAIACFLALVPGSALALGTLDQSQMNTSGYTINWLKPDSLAQSFTAERTGKLDTVEISADAYGASVTIQIENHVGTVLAKKTQTLNDAGWTQIHFSAPPSVAKGTAYAIVVTPTTEVGWRGDCTNVYAGGSARVEEGTTWYSIPGWAVAFGAYVPDYCAQDFAFITYVTPPAPATPKPTVAPTTIATPSLAATPASTPSINATATPGETVLAITGTPGASTPVGRAGSQSGGGSTDSTLPIVAAGAGGAVLGLALAGLAILLLRRRKGAKAE